LTDTSTRAHAREGVHVLVLGSGGREHALAWKLAQSPRVNRVSVAPGNAGTALEPAIDNVGLDPMDFPSLVDFARREHVDLTVVGPEAPLVAGVVDHFRAAGLRCFGPGAAAARLEGSKAFSKDFLARHGIPTAAYATFTEVAPALAYLRERGAPIVVKADGLAAGKGVIVAATLDEAEAAVTDMLSGNAFGEAGCRVVIEEFLDGDLGPNTGGMGAYSPAPVVDEAVHARIMEQIIEPTVTGMTADGCPYIGFLYAGLMISPTGEPRVIEFNCRFGDPETQPIMLRLASDLFELCDAAIDGKLEGVHAQWDPRPALGVVLAAGGYPGSYDRGMAISGLDVDTGGNCKVFHAGTTLEGGTVRTNGGRVLCVTALGEDIAVARQQAYASVENLCWEGMQFRRDIGWRALQRYSQKR